MGILDRFSAILYKTILVTSCLPLVHQVSSKKGSTLKGKNLLPMGAYSFLLEYTRFQKRGKIILKALPALKMYPFVLNFL